MPQYARSTVSIGGRQGRFCSVLRPRQDSIFTPPLHVTLKHSGH